MAGARWAQRDLLGSSAKSDIRVFAIWFRMYPGDSEASWPSALLTDNRVQHRWDEPKAAGRWFLENLKTLKPSRGGDGKFPQRVDAMWDTYILFDRTATWKDTPDGLLSWGYTIMRTREQLQRDFEYLSGGLRPAGPPYTLARGGPPVPRSARVAPSLPLVRR